MKTAKLLMVLLFLIITTKSIKSQNLSIDSNGLLTVSANSYLYVDGNLAVNATGNLEIQSTETKSGSLLLNNTSTSSGDITYKRYLKNDGWFIASAPVTTQGVNDFVTNATNDIPTNASNLYALGVYDNDNIPTKKWVYYPASPVGNLEEGVGLAVKRNAAGNLTFKGNLKTTDVVKTIKHGTNGSWNSIGNPYPAFLPMNNGANATNNLLKDNITFLQSPYEALYLWDGSSYQPVNHADSGPAFLHPGQGFIVKAKTGSNRSFTFSKNLQTQQQGANLFLKVAETPEIKINLTSNKKTKYTRIKYIENTTLGFDAGYDAGTFNNGSTASLSIDTHLVEDSDGTNITLQCLPKTAFNNAIIPLSVSSKANQKIVFSVDKTNIPTNIHLFIEDKGSSLN